MRTSNEVRDSFWGVQILVMSWGDRILHHSNDISVGRGDLSILCPRPSPKVPILKMRDLGQFCTPGKITHKITILYDKWPAMMFVIRFLAYEYW